MTTTPIPDTRVDLIRADEKLDAAAAVLGPILTGTVADPTAIAKAVHDALNHLTGAKIRVELAIHSLEEATR